MNNQHPSTATIHPELRSVLERHRSDTPVQCAATRASLLPTLKAVNAALFHLAELEAGVAEAEQAAHDGTMGDNMKWLHDEIAAVKHRGEQVRSSLREFNHSFSSLARALVRPEAAILRDMGIESTTAETASPVVATTIDPTVQGPNKLELREAYEEDAVRSSRGANP
jgi:hypothetical protein